MSNFPYDVLCSTCKLRLFRVICGSEDKPIVCYKSNCPQCGGESFNKRVNRGRIASDLNITDVIQNEDEIVLTLEKW